MISPVSIFSKGVVLTLCGDFSRLFRTISRKPLKVRPSTLQNQDNLSGVGYRNPYFDVQDGVSGGGGLNPRFPTSQETMWGKPPISMQSSGSGGHL